MQAMNRRMSRLLTVLLVLWGTSAAAQEAFEEEQSHLKFGFEVKADWRDSDSARFPSPFPFPPQALPLGQTQGFQETVDAGSHAEVAVVTLFLDSRWRDNWTAKVKLDLIDLHDRNPTSEDNEFDLDEAWIRWGQETEPGRIPEERGFYFKVGKFGKFERQDDRHLESYGLISTAFNRFEDAGVEIGVDLHRRLYLKASITQGNPLYLRDPNALAGDNGISILDLRQPDFKPNPDPDLKSGFPIFYDADIEDLDFANPESGFGIGLRFGKDPGLAVVDVLFWRYERTLADTIDLTGSFYGGDLDLLFGPFSDHGIPAQSSFSLAVTDDDKVEAGANVWAYVGDFTFFGQYVDQDLAGMSRTGWETEVSWSFDLPFFGSAFGRQLFPYVQPAFRFSRLEPEITGANPGLFQYPAPSVLWYWEKTDFGLRLGILEKLLDLTVEWNLNDFIVRGKEEHADEFLATVRWRMDWRR
jgi:hypothetical protein